MEHLVLPYTRETFLRLLDHYNAAIWPLQPVAYGLAFLIVGAILRPFAGSGRVIAVLLAASWLWLGIVYHAVYFVILNWVAWLFALFFVLEGILLIWTGLLHGRTAFRFAGDRPAWAGLCFVAISLLAFPLAFLTTQYPITGMPLLATASYPTTFFTLGILLLADGRAPWHLMAIPVAWALTAGALEWLSQAPHPWVMPCAGVAALAFTFEKNRLIRA
jgi:Family of unknown function (DUF6064)